MNNLNKIVEDFYRIKKLGFVKSTRPNNKDGGIGNTYEDLLGIKENNKNQSDYLGFEIKSKREFNSSFVSLFTKSPSFPKGANSILREKYGEIRDDNFEDKKKLFASVFGHRYSLIYAKYNMKLKIENKNQKLFLSIFDLNFQEIDNVYWNFGDLENSAKKIDSLMLVTAEIKDINGFSHFHYNKAEIYSNFDFKKFLKQIKIGGIMFDLRIGVYNSGRNIGKTHDHGSGFRIKKENFKSIYKNYIEL